MNSKFSGKGRIIIPSDVNRDIYIRRCYDTGRVSMFTHGAGVIQQAAISTHCINDIHFPSKPTDFGSSVAYNKIPNSEEYIIYAVFKEIKDVHDLYEYQYSLGRHTDGGISKITGDPDDGTMTITVDHDINGGELAINIGNKKTGGKLTINVSTSVDTDSKEFNILAYDKFSVTIPKSGDNEITSISYIKGEGFSYSDEFGNQEYITLDSHRINHKKSVIIGNGKYSAVLYEELDSFLNDLITTISGSTVVTALGTMPLVNSSDILSYVNRLKELKMSSTYLKIQ